MPHPLAHRLADAWRQEGPTALETPGQVGEKSQQVIQEALLDHGFQAVFHEAMQLLSENERTGCSLLQREAERLACVHSWLEDGVPGREMALLALPCGANAAWLAHWLQTPEHQQALGSTLVEHLAESWAIPTEAIERLVLFPAPVTPDAVAALSSDGRRSLVEEMMQRNRQGEAFQHLHDALILPVEGDPFSTSLGTEGLLLFAVGVHTGWSIDQVSEASDHVRDMVQEQLEGPDLQRAEEAWMERWSALPDFPLLAYVPCPTSLNQGLMHLLHARVMAARLASEDPEDLTGQLETQHALRFAPVLQFTAAPAPQDPEIFQIDAVTDRGPLPTIKVSYHWALASGPLALQTLLTEAFDMNQAGSNPARLISSEPLHPAWQHAHPPAPGLH